MCLYKIIDISDKNPSKYSCQVKSEYFLNRINNYNNPNDKLRVFYSYIALKELCYEKYKIDIDTKKINRNEFNKPVVEGGEFCFNISHSENIVAVIVDKKNVSIDVQKISKYNKKIAKKYYTKLQNFILKLSLNKNYKFTKYWCKLECGIKYFGNYLKMRQSLMEKGNKLIYKYIKISDKKNNKYICCMAYKN